MISDRQRFFLLGQSKLPTRRLPTSRILGVLIRMVIRPTFDQPLYSDLDISTFASWLPLCLESQTLTTSCFGKSEFHAICSFFYRLKFLRGAIFVNRSPLYSFYRCRRREPHWPAPLKPYAIRRVGVTLARNRHPRTIPFL